MAHRLSKEELDEQFEQFLKESLSDDSFDSSKKSSILESIGKPKTPRSKKKHSSPWWATADDSDEELRPRMYVKPKMPQHTVSIGSANSEGTSETMPVTNSRPVEKQNGSKSLNRTLEKCLQLEQYHISKKAQYLEKDDSSSCDSSENSDGMLTNQSFMKSQRTSQPIEEEEETDEKHCDMPVSAQDPVCESMDRDSLDVDDSVVASGPNPVLHGFGLDTLEEQEEKERFFAKLEKGASSTIDYSKLNKELDSSDSTQFTALIRKEEKSKSGQEQIKQESNDFPGNYSEDFEEDAESMGHFSKNYNGVNNNTDEKADLNIKVEEKPGMLAKVVFLDSLDSTLDTQKLLQKTDPGSFIPQGANDGLATGASNAYTNSDIEALQQAYLHIEQSMDGSMEEKSSLKVLEQTNITLTDAFNSNEKIIGKKSTSGSDMPTLDELMQPIRGESTSVNPGLPSDNSQIPTDYLLRQFHGHKAAETTSQVEIQENQSSDLLNQWKNEKPESRNSFLFSEIELPYAKKEDLITLEVPGHERFPKVPDYSEFGVDHQDEKNSCASTQLHKRLNNDSPESLHKKTLNKDKGLTSLLKKPQNRHFANVRSSGYGKASTQLNSGKSSSKELHFKATKEKIPIDGKQKGFLSDTRTIRFADSTSISLKCQTSGISAQQPKDKLHESFNEILSGKSTLSKAIDKDLYIFSQLQNVEEESERLKADISKKEEEFQQKLEQERERNQRELHHLKQENYILQAKLHAEEEKRKKKIHLLGEPGEAVTEEKLCQVRQEIEEQETLLQGYQLENQKLYQQVKELQIKNKQNTEQMFQENAFLKAELATLRDQLNLTVAHNQRAPSENYSKNPSTTELLDEMHVLQKRETHLLEDIARLKQDKQALEVDLVQMRKERDLAKLHLAQSCGDKSYEMKIMEETFKQEISRLNKKLQWFAENQDLLDKDAARLRDANEQIENLKIQVEKLGHEAGNQSAQQQNRLKDRAADAKRIQDLERQVKEMEAIIKRRHPNSIPALIYAAATAPSLTVEHSSKSNTVAHLERRIHKLESDLECKDEDAKKTLRSMEQQFQKMKIHYENRINELEGLVTSGPLNELQKYCVDSTKLKALEKELSICKETHQITVTGLYKELENLKEVNAFLERKINTNDGRFASTTNQSDESSDRAKLARLDQELSIRSIEVQELTKTVERLQRERTIMLSEKNTSDPIWRMRKQTCAASPYKSNNVDSNNFPGTLDEKLYQPGTFSDIHISDIQQENDRLKAKVGRLASELMSRRRIFKTLC
uniref:Centrosomal protein of 162 kDa n=1 Tax=Leptobrachium leishanense TaxID=445787 RepID=A0A8C5QKV6_9ANUR